MAGPDQAYYEYYRRQHRILGAYLAMHCWHNGFDAVIVDRSTLAHIHELKRFTEEHLSWLQRDLKPYFAHSSKLYYTKTRGKFAAVALSRVPIPDGFGRASLGDEQRAKQWQSKGFRVCALSELPSCNVKFTEKTAVTFLSQLAVGLSVPEAGVSKVKIPRRRSTPST